MTTSGDGHHQDEDADCGLWFATNEADFRMARRRFSRRSIGLRRTCLAVTAFVMSILFLGVIGGGFFFARLAQGPIALDIKPQIMAALNDRVGHGFRFDLDSTSIEATDHGPALIMNALSVSDALGRRVVTAPKAAISVDTMGLLFGRIAPTRLEINDIDLRLVIRPDGQVAVSAGAVKDDALPLSSAFSGASSGLASPAGGDPLPVAAKSEPPGNAAIRALTAVLRALVDATTAPDSAIGSLDHVGVTGRLVLDDRTHATTTVFRNASLSYAKLSDGSAELQVAADGPAGRWSILAQASRAADATKTMTVAVNDISLDEITLAGGLRNLGFDFDMPVSAKLNFHLGADGALDVARGSFTLGSGYFKLDDPDHEPLLIDSASGGFHFDPASHGIAIEPTTLHAGESVFVMNGRIDPPHSADGAWAIEADASGTFGAERPGEKPIKITQAGLVAHVAPADRRFVIDHMSVTGPEVDYWGTVELKGDESGGFKLMGTHKVTHMPAQALVRLWPSMIAAPVRAWFLQNCHGGWIDSGTAVTDLTDGDLVTMRSQHSVPDDHVRVEFSVSDLDLGFMPGVPALSNLDGSGLVTGHTVHFKAMRGDMEVSPGHKLQLVGGDFNVADSDPKPTPATITAHAAGSVDVVADLLARPALKPYANVPIDAASLKGQIDANLRIALKLGDNIPPEETKIDVDATASNFSADKLIGKEGLVDAAFTLKADRSGISAKGDGRMFGAPATIELRKPPGGGASEAVITLALDDAARAKVGLTLGKGLTGLVAAKISTSLTSTEKGKAAVDLDFTKAAMDGLVPGFSKPAGRPGRATLNLIQHEGGISLDNIAFEGGGAAVRGSAELDAGGGFVSAKLAQVRFSPGDDLKVDAAQSADGLKLVVRGANMDGRPFLKWLSGATPGGAPDVAEPAKNTDVDLHVNVLTGLNAQAVTSADLRVSRRDGQVKHLQMTGKFGRQRLIISTVERNGLPVFVINSNDAGASLSFLDLYKRMVGGRLDANVSIVDGHMQGFAAIHDFTLREDPAIRKLATESYVNQNHGNSDPQLNGSASVMTFTKLQGYFSRTGSRVDIHDAAFFGPQAGATVEGAIDFSRDQVNLTGTYVPIYGVNNLFSQIPLFGPILGGGVHEGLFALNFRITGSPAAPVLNVNPLSALAPGFLRKVFGAIDSAAEGQPPPRDRASAPGDGQSPELSEPYTEAAPQTEQE